MASARPAGPSGALVGAILSRRWRLLRALGEGGMGEVYAAEPTEGGPTQAVKLLRREFVANPQVRSRFLEEGRTCMRLMHPNIVHVRECATAEDGSPYMVMDLCDGVPLSAYTQNGGRVPLAQAVPIMQGILAGLAAAHAQGVVHRDLKPDNVFLTRGAGGAFSVKLLDFGIAKVMDVAGGMGNRTSTGMLLGTPAYMSPEQARNARDVDQRADLWSAGVMLYEMVTGRVAFPAPTEYARLAALLSTEPEPIERVDPSLAPLSSFLLRALKKNREERFSSAAEMGRALAAAVPARMESGLPGTAAPGLPLDRLVDGPQTFSPAPPVPSPAGQSPAPSPAPPPAGGTETTLASPAAHAVAEPAPQVVIVRSEPPALEETLRSKERAKDSTLRSNDAPLAIIGVRRGLVALLVVVALVAGFLLGWGYSRLP
ncbi:MAG TPA: serine/threonine-protein kinase [Polyangiaceae bacterium]|nr:serine/threonine-protein kinase [Polyangiaceae bacterium]